jgi:hypothetical protein
VGSHLVSLLASRLVNHLESQQESRVGSHLVSLLANRLVNHLGSQQESRVGSHLVSLLANRLVNHLRVFLRSRSPPCFKDALKPISKGATLSSLGWSLLASLCCPLCALGSTSASLNRLEEPLPTTTRRNRSCSSRVWHRLSHWVS